ncbi:V-set and transmembrane domain-containing protein 2-like protein [Acanthochromis polyacanthus]|uniref:V-set and transmembrane domain-containing protein 2-like protein n=1 Tax=Acanthochromis polyacanthus TaxID=80966 RepID=A0A3Q1FT37_9TELE|nr:V-set and transmembrane domain-containing protein 2-like protein [Acanthochromis polyacanthus]
MGPFGVIMGILQYAGLYIQLNAALNDGHGEVDNHISGNALFTEVPHDIRTHSGEDVEMACSFRGAGSPSYSLEIQWWYIKDHRDWQEKPGHITNNVVAQEETSKDATKISVVKVAGSNISHKLRLSSVKPSDEGTYECRVIDYSGAVAQRHRVWAYLQVEPERSQGSDELQEPGQRSVGSPPHSPHQTEGRELKKRSAGSTTDCNESCVL